MVEEFQFDPEVAKVLVFKYDVSYLTANLDLSMKRILQSRKGKKIENITAYVGSAIRDNYAADNSSEPVPATPTEVASVQGDRRRAIDSYLEKAYQTWYKKAVDKHVESEFKTQMKAFSEWLMNQPEQLIYAPINELLVSRGFAHPQVKAYFQSWLVEKQNLKEQFSKNLFMTESGYTIENEGEVSARLMRRGRLMDV